MIKSMTGYGFGAGENEDITVEVEAKAINHRYCDINLRLPRDLSFLEDEIRKTLRRRFYRGHFDVYVNFTIKNKEKRIQINQQLAQEYYDLLLQLRDNLQLAGEIDLKLLTALPGVISPLPPIKDKEAAKELTFEALTIALDSVAKMRLIEGKALEAEIQQQIEKIKEKLSLISERSDQFTVILSNRLGAKIKELALQPEIDEQRLAQEVAYSVQRLDISEETLRLASHLNQLQQLLAAEESVGKKADFLMQEMNREINTIGSKVPDVDITPHVIEIKSQLEKIREQIQNVE